MSPNFEYIAAVLDDYCDMQTSGFIPTANRYPVSDIQEQVALLGQLGSDSNAVLVNRIAELELDVSMHRNAEIMWEKTMMQAVGEDGPSDVIKAIDKIKAERDNAWTELREIRWDINANREESTADEVRRVVAELDDARHQLNLITPLLGGTAKTLQALCESIISQIGPKFDLHQQAKKYWQLLIRRQHERTNRKETEQATRPVVSKPIQRCLVR